MNKVVAQTASVEIGHKEFPKNTLYIELDEGDVITVKTVAEGKVVGTGTFEKWKASTNVPYATKAAAITAIRAAIYA